jgi:hypothetical protein
LSQILESRRVAVSDGGKILSRSDLPQDIDMEGLAGGASRNFLLYFYYGSPGREA